MRPIADGRLQVADCRSANLQSAICHLQWSNIAIALALVVLCWFLFFYQLAERDLWSSHEARAAQDAQTILLDEQWGLPHLFDRKVELQKPPLYYWLVAVLTQLRGGGVDAWAVRFPAAGTALLGVMVIGCLSLWRGRVVAGFVSAGVLATALHYTWLARTGRIDMPLTCVVAAALVSFYLGHRCIREQNGHLAWLFLLIAYTMTALAVLLKGPIGLMLPFSVAFAFLISEALFSRSHLQARAGHYQGNHLARARRCEQLNKSWARSLAKTFRTVHQYGLWWGPPLLLAIALPWYVWANARTDGALFRVFFWEHNVERGLGGGSLRAHPWWFYVPRLGVDFLPWSPLLPVAAWLMWRRGWWRADPEIRFGFVWLSTVLVLLSCARFKRADYLLPAYPGAALFLGCVAERCCREFRIRKFLIPAFGLVLCICSIGWYFYVDKTVPQLDAEHETRRFGQEIRRLAPAPQLILFFRTESHALAFHVGRPIDTLLEWENLDAWAARPERYFVVMPSEYARQWAHHLKSGQLGLVLKSTVLAGAKHDDPLVLLCTRPEAGPAVP